MGIIAGRISGWLNDPSDKIEGILLDNGRRVRFSPEDAERVLAIAPFGSRVEVSVLRAPGEDTANAIRIVNLDSQQYITIHASPIPDQPEASTDLCPPPGTVAPLAPASPHYLEPPNSKYSVREAWIIRKEVADEIERAHAALRLIQAMIAPENDRADDFSRRTDYRLLPGIDRISSC